MFAGKEDSYPHTLLVFKERLFFVADDGKHGTELYQTDGTAAGTSLVKDINPEGNSHAQGLVVYKGQLYFGADDGKHGYELWRSDGTAEGTFLVKDLTSGSEDSALGQLFVHTDGKLRFYLGKDIYETDGTAESVKKV